MKNETNKSCYFCDFCNYCDYCNCCDYCNYCDYCSYCNYCDACHSCNYCNYCSSSNYCKNLKMTEFNIFCWSKEYDSDTSFQQPRYRVFNTEISEEDYRKIKVPQHSLVFNKDDNYDVRFEKAFQRMWNELTAEEQQVYLDLPHFSWEGFTYITGVTPDMVKRTYPKIESAFVVNGKALSEDTIMKLHEFANDSIPKSKLASALSEVLTEEQVHAVLERLK